MIKLMEIIGYKIYCDMDGVLVDFDKGYYDLTGIDIKNQFLTSKEFWAPIRDKEYEFWTTLEWMPDGKELWNYIKGYKPKLLSAPSSNVMSRIGKHEWVKRELPGVELILKKAELKKELADPMSILIDDKKENIDGWRSNGGIGILHISADDTIKQLKLLLRDRN